MPPPPHRTTVLVVDDDTALRMAVSRALRLEGYEVIVAVDGYEALETQRASPADLVVLDVNMPGVDGLETCRRLRARKDEVPVLMLTALDAVGDRVAGLDAGADDYLVKPFELGELLARLRALLRRTVVAEAGEELRYADLTVDPRAHQVWRGRRRVELTRTEFALLEELIRHSRQVLSRTTLLERVWGYDSAVVSNSLEVFVGYLRRKLEADGEPRLVQTVRGIGYVLREP